MIQGVEKMYNIHSTKNAILHIPSNQERDSFGIRFRVKGMVTNSLNDCSSFVLSLKNSTSIQLSLKIDELINNTRVSFIEIYNPKFIKKKLNNNFPLIKCNEWTEIWLEVSENDVSLGLGSAFAMFTLNSVQSNINKNIEQILFRNTIPNIVNHVDLYDKGVFKFFI